MDLEHLNGRMVENTLEAGKKENSMERVHIILVQEMCEKVLGILAREPGQINN